MKRKIIFRADAGRNIGYGHFIRSLALASYLKDDFDCIFTTYNPDLNNPSPYQLREIERICSYLHIDAQSTGEFNDKFISVLKGDEIVVLDNYYFAHDFQRQVKHVGSRLVCVDDLGDRSMACDLLLTGMPLEREFFHIGADTKFLGGLKHSFLREPFLNASPKHRQGEIRWVVIAIGGADPLDLTNKLIRILNKVDASLRTDVIAGDTVKIDPQIVEKINLHKNLSAKEIVELFMNADMGIFPASTVCIEALACGLPLAVGWYVDNQKCLYEYGVKTNLFYPLGDLRDPDEDIENRIKSAIKSLKADHKAVTIDFAQGKQDIISAFKSL